MRRNARQFFLFLLTVCFSVAFIPCIGAAENPSVIREKEIETLFDAYLRENDLNPDLISVAYEYTGTGERWYHLEDRWYYSASLYKVPLMMLLAEREYLGELTKDSRINGLPLETIEEEVLVNSNNPIAYSTLLYIAQPDVCRKMFCRYSDLPEEYYTWDFYGGSYFTARFMTDVMSTLYRNTERFPRMTDCMKRAQPDHYFRLKLGDRWEVAQKYGSYQDEDGTDWNHTSGIIYTPHPFLLTVMTRYGGISETIIGDLAELFCEYTIQADSRLPAEQPENAETTNALSDDTTAADTLRRTEDRSSDLQKSEPTQDEERTMDSEQAPPEDAVKFEVTDSGTLTPAYEAESPSGRLAVIAAALGLELILGVSMAFMRYQRGKRQKRRRY